MISFFVAITILLFMITYGEGYSINQVLLAVVIVIGNGGYFALSVSEDLQHAILSTQLTYTIGLFAPMLLFINIAEIYRVKIPGWLLCIMYAVQFGLFLCTASIGRTDIWYTSVDYRRMGEIVYLQKEYGSLHTVYIVTMYAYFLLLVICSAGIIKGKRRISKQDATAIFFLEFVTIAVYVAERLVGLRIELFPFVINFCEILLLIPITKLNTYSLKGNNELVKNRLDNMGYIFFDRRMRFMGGNPRAFELFPELNDWALEKKIPGSGGRFNTYLRQPLYRFIEGDGEAVQLGAFTMKDTRISYRIGMIRNRTGISQGYIIELDETVLPESAALESAE
jgi:hypothetical protein